jgi:hypothetical protein
MANVRVTDLAEIPRSIRFTEGNLDFSGGSVVVQLVGGWPT